METVFKIAAISMVSSVICMLLKQSEKALAIGISVLACVFVVLAGIRLLQPVIALMDKLENLSQWDTSVTEPMFKIAGVGILAQISAGVCSDAGEETLSKMVEISACIMAVYLSIPLMLSVLNLLEDLLGGGI